MTFEPWLAGIKLLDCVVEPTVVAGRWRQWIGDGEEFSPLSFGLLRRGHCTAVWVVRTDDQILPDKLAQIGQCLFILRYRVMEELAPLGGDRLGLCAELLEVDLLDLRWLPLITVCGKPAPTVPRRAGPGKAAGRRRRNECAVLRSERPPTHRPKRSSRHDASLPASVHFDPLWPGPRSHDGARASGALSRQERDDMRLLQDAELGAWRADARRHRGIPEAHADLPRKVTCR